MTITLCAVYHKWVSLIHNLHGIMLWVMMTLSTSGTLSSNEQCSQPLIIYTDIFNRRYVESDKCIPELMNWNDDALVNCFTWMGSFQIQNLMKFTSWIWCSLNLTDDIEQCRAMHVDFDPSYFIIWARYCKLDYVCFCNS